MINLLILTFRLPLALRQFRSFSIIDHVLKCYHELWRPLVKPCRKF